MSDILDIFAAAGDAVRQLLLGVDDEMAFEIEPNG